MMSDYQLKIGALGCGGFGLFAMEQFKQVEGVELKSIYEPNAQAAKTAQATLNVSIAKDLRELLGHPEINLIYINTPPFLHHEQVLAALKAGKHVICEKPLAVNMQQAREMLDCAKEKKLLCTTNLMQRYNPFFESVRKLVNSKILGEFIHGFFENYACDEQLHPQHWFWDRTKSGGIFIEHGVHFFDLFAGWVGEGEVVAAQRVFRPAPDTGHIRSTPDTSIVGSTASLTAGSNIRSTPDTSNIRPTPDTSIEEQVHATVRYKNGMLANFYHGFTQTKKMDRQEMRLLFERGDITLYEWVPTRARIDALVTEKEKPLLQEMFPESRLEILERYTGEKTHCGGRHKKYEAQERIHLHAGEKSQKQDVYHHLLRSMIRDQLAFLRNSFHQRIVQEENGYHSLKLAVDATRLAGEV